MVADYEKSSAAIHVAPLQRAEAMHRLYRHLARERRHQSLDNKGKAIIHSALRPLVRLVRAWSPTRVHGPTVVQITGMPLWRQFLQQWLVAVRFDFSADTYYRYRLYQLDHIGDAVLFFPLNVHMTLRSYLYEHLNIDVTRLEDKRDFYRVCAKHGLPIPTTVAEFTNGAAHAWAGGSERVVLPQRDLFSKPAGSLEGKGAGRWIWQQSGHYVGENGQILTADELLGHLGTLSRSEPYILQERLTNHPTIAALGPRALCTARIVTCRGINRSPEHLVSIFRLPAATAAAAADNFAAGGFASPIDPATGTLGNAVRKDLRYAAIDFLEYPGSRQPFTGVHLPHWMAALEVCLQAHRFFSDFPSVGWDVAITPDGPVLIEGNHDWDVQLAQQPGCRPLGSTRFVESFHSFVS